MYRQFSLSHSLTISLSLWISQSPSHFSLSFLFCNLYNRHSHTDLSIALSPPIIYASQLFLLTCTMYMYLFYFVLSLSFSFSLLPFTWSCPHSLATSPDWEEKLPASGEAAAGMGRFPGLHMMLQMNHHNWHEPSLILRMDVFDSQWSKKQINRSVSVRRPLPVYIKLVKTLSLNLYFISKLTQI